MNRNGIKNNTFKTIFKKGIKSWFLVIIVCFIFSFIGSSNSEQTAFINVADSFLGLDTSLVPNSIEIINKYIISLNFIDNISFTSKETLVLIINSLVKSHAWFINFVALNFAYFKRNTGEVLVSLIVISFISLIIKLFVQNAFVIGKNRYFMENRFNKEVKVGRIFAPFHKEDLFNIIKVMIIYNVSLFLWSLTIIGVFYKYYQYRMIPYLLAENPKLKWKQVKEMSILMTNGNKLNMFKIELSFIYMFLLKFIPVIGLLFGVPFEETLNSEFYFNLRDKYKDKKDIFIESSFNTKVYPDSKKQEYLLNDVIVSPKELRKNINTDLKRNYNGYNIYDYIIFFFVFCFIGYIWEVGLHFVQFHEFVNRGTMYGPWLPIYGFGGVFVIFLLDKLKANKVELFISIICLCAILEYFTSWFLDFFYNSSYWDYKNMFLNVNGRICFAGLIAFGLGGFLGIYVVAPRISLFLYKLGKNKTRLLCLILVSLYVIDFICTLVFGFNTGSGVGNTF